VGPWTTRTSFGRKLAGLSPRPSSRQAAEFRAGPFLCLLSLMSVKVPVALSVLYIETQFEPEFVPYADFPDGGRGMEVGDSSVELVSRPLPRR